MAADITVLVDDPLWRQSVRGAASLCETTILEVLAAEKLARRKLAVTLSLSNDAAVKVLNRQWRGKNKPTNVLSFPFDEEGFGIPVPKGMPEPLGDIIIARETVLREAESEGKTNRHHLMHLVVHGMLHLLGYDHMTPDEAEEMEQREREILARLKVPDPYAETEPVAPKAAKTSSSPTRKK